MSFIDNTKKKKKLYSINHLSRTGKKVHSATEEEIANYLDSNGIPYKKPTTAFRGQYYKNYRFVPDFLIDGVIVEYCGIKGNKNYDNTIELKKQNRYPNKEYVFLYDINKIGSLCTRFKYLIGKNPQINLDLSFAKIIKEEEEFKNLLQHYNKEIGNKVMFLFYKECSSELKEARYKIFDKFMRDQGKTYLHSLLLSQRQKTNSQQE